MPGRFRLRDADDFNNIANTHLALKEEVQNSKAGLYPKRHGILAQRLRIFLGIAPTF